MKRFKVVFKSRLELLLTADHYTIKYDELVHWVYFYTDYNTNYTIIAQFKLEELIGIITPITEPQE